jgi:XRE family transcriptional regulator, aerobic/anaerobic benzoate catabolism transcriptional regulator
MRAEAEGALLSALGNRVRGLRAELGLTRRELARQSGLSERFVAELEAGRANISVVNLSELARVLGVAPGALIDGEGAGAVRPRAREPGVIALLGLRGAGKSTVGKKLAGALGAPFFELDRLAEAEAGMRLQEIFALHGEEYFRRLELAALKRFLSTQPRAVLATGGGLVTSPEAFRLLLERTRTVWLKALPDEHWERVVRQGDLRPMQNRPQAKAELKRRLKEREPLYARAELTVSTSGRTVDEVVTELREAV